MLWDLRGKGDVEGKKSLKYSRQKGRKKGKMGEGLPDADLTKSSSSN